MEILSEWIDKTLFCGEEHPNGARQDKTRQDRTGQIDEYEPGESSMQSEVRDLGNSSQMMRATFTPFQSQLHQGSRYCHRMDIVLELVHNSRDSSRHYDSRVGNHQNSMSSWDFRCKL